MSKEELITSVKKCKYYNGSKKKSELEKLNESQLMEIVKMNDVFSRFEGKIVFKGWRVKDE